jgi:hypothetical protein
MQALRFKSPASTKLAPAFPTATQPLPPTTATANQANHAAHQTIQNANAHQAIQHANPNAAKSLV